MYTVVMKVQPFLKYQTAFIINENDEIEEAVKFTMDRVNEIVFKHTPVAEVKISGNKKYILNIVQNIKQYELFKFNQNTIKFIYMEGKNSEILN